MVSHETVTLQLGAIISNRDEFTKECRPLESFDSWSTREDQAWLLLSYEPGRIGNSLCQVSQFLPKVNNSFKISFLFMSWTILFASSGGRVKT